MGCDILFSILTYLILIFVLALCPAMQCTLLASHNDPEDSTLWQYVQFQMSWTCNAVPNTHKKNKEIKNKNAKSSVGWGWVKGHTHMIPNQGSCSTTCWSPNTTSANTHHIFSLHSGIIWTSTKWSGRCGITCKQPHGNTMLKNVVCGNAFA